MEDLVKYDFNGYSINATLINGEVYFIGNEIAKAMKYSNYRNTVGAKVDDEDKLRTHMKYAGQNREVTLINESGMFSLVLSSNLPDAKKFKHWVTSEVLPSIRKHGAYMDDSTLDAVADNPDLLIKLATNLKEERRQRMLAQQQVQELQPIKTYYDLVLSSTNTVTVTQIAKDYGLTAKKLNEILHESHVQFKQNGTWLLYSGLASRGYTKTETYVDPKGNSYVNTKWTQKGRLFIYEQLKENGILPVIEKEG